jgi:crossover junction endodeoxyribonuclease RusA
MILTLPWPPAELSPNARKHWAVKSRVTKGARALAAYEAKRLVHDGIAFQDGPIRMVWTFHPPDKRRRDRDNMIASCKAYADGIADGLGVNDARFEPTYRAGVPKVGGLVVVEVVA